MVYRWWEFTDDRVSVHDDIPMDNIRMDHFINLFVVKFYCLKRRKSSGLALRYSGYIRLGWVDSLVKLKQCNPTQPKINPSMPSRGGGTVALVNGGFGRRSLLSRRLSWTVGSKYSNAVSRKSISLSSQKQNKIILVSTQKQKQSKSGIEPSQSKEALRDVATLLGF